MYQAVWTPVPNAEYVTQQEHGKKALDGKKAASIMTTWVAFI